MDKIREEIETINTDMIELQKHAKKEFYKQIKYLQELIRQNTKLHEDIELSLEDTYGKAILFPIAHEHNGYDLMSYYCVITKDTNYNIEVLIKPSDGDYNDFKSSSLGDAIESIGSNLNTLMNACDMFEFTIEKAKKNMITLY